MKYFYPFPIISITHSSSSSSTKSDWGVPFWLGFSLFSRTIFDPSATGSMSIVSFAFYFSFLFNGQKRGRKKRPEEINGHLNVPWPLSWPFSGFPAEREGVFPHVLGDNIPLYVWQWMEYKYWYRNAQGTIPNPIPVPSPSPFITFPANQSSVSVSTPRTATETL